MFINQKKFDGFNIVSLPSKKSIRSKSPINLKIWIPKILFWRWKFKFIKFYGPTTRFRWSNFFFQNEVIEPKKWPKFSVSKSTVSPQFSNYLTFLSGSCFLIGKPQYRKFRNSIYLRLSFWKFSNQNWIFQNNRIMKLVCRKMKLVKSTFELEL